MDRIPKRAVSSTLDFEQNRSLFSMENKRWHSFLIGAVLLLTVYNILPTVLFYSKPLYEPIQSKKGMEIAESMAERINSLETEAVDWIEGYLKVLAIRPSSIHIDPTEPQLVKIKLPSQESAEKFKLFLNRSSEATPFYPSQLTLVESKGDPLEVSVRRKIPVTIDKNHLSNYFTFVEKWEKEGQPTADYLKLTRERLGDLALATGGISDSFQLLSLAMAEKEGRGRELIDYFAENFSQYKQAFGQDSPIAKRFFATTTQGFSENRPLFLQTAISHIAAYKDEIQRERVELKELESHRELSSIELERLLQLTAREEKLLDLIYMMKDYSSIFTAAEKPLSWESVVPLIEKENSLYLGQRHPLIREIGIDFSQDKLYLSFHPDVELLFAHLKENPKKELISQILYRELQSIQKKTAEKLSFHGSRFEAPLSSLPQSRSLLIANLAPIAQAEVDQLKKHLLSWTPESEDLKPSYYPVNEGKEALLSKELHFVIYAPSLSTEPTLLGFKTESIYLVAKGLQKIAKKFENSASLQAQLFIQDWVHLRKLLSSIGAIGYPGTTFPLSSDFSDDFIFEIPDYYLPYLQASREQFHLFGSKKGAILECSNLKQRILAENQIDDKEQEDLLRWRDEHNRAVLTQFKDGIYVPKPTKSPFWNNLKISLRKYWRGDDRKILKWGLDLSGGKSVQIELRDNFGKPIVGEAELRQGVNELYNRVNKMGVSEVQIRVEGESIVADFPGSQEISAEELIKASSMTFHVVNEKFSSSNSKLAPVINRFLQEVWDEAVVTNRKSIRDINQIAWANLYGKSIDTESAHPRTESAVLLHQAGLRLADPLDPPTSQFNDTLSRIGCFKETLAWQSHPLIILFHNYALDGASLESVRASYDPQSGNYLSFSVQPTRTLPNQISYSPRKELSLWTSIFSKDRVMGTPLEEFSPGRGWRMAIVLNEFVISAPPLSSEISDHAMISGNFSQREVQKLEADLKAGSLSYVPYILSEQNVSPELGSQERNQGIFAAALAFALVIAVMVGYYRFAGAIASIALLFNLLIIWAVLQNLGAALTLPGIAGIILTMGMAVDANVLVFERIREELEKGSALISAIHQGYSRAFSAIFDSNITTILAAFILLRFDSGPVKGFAVTLIIGIVSSMFTSLFVTRSLFDVWLKRFHPKKLTLCSAIRAEKIPFLSWKRPVAIASALFLLTGALFFHHQRDSLFGLDFTGGYAMTLQLPKQEGVDYRKEVRIALEKAGIPAQDIQLRELSSPSHLRLFLSKQLPSLASGSAESEALPSLLPFQVQSIIGALKESGISLSQDSIQEIASSFTSVSGQLSDSMKEQAIWGLLIALGAILLYLTFRFEWIYAASATLGLAYDLLITLASLSLLHAFGVPIQIDMNAIAALLTIIGYSLNDTIIVFDRIREELHQRIPFSTLINRALNQTLSRTLLTSSTTLVVLLPLVSFGGTTLFGFSLLMSLGVLIGTFSSFFIASPILYLLESRSKQIKEN